MGDRLLMGSDSPPGYFETPQGFYVQISVDEPEKAERVFHALAENPKVKMAIEQTFWSVRFGMLVDQFGIPWMVNCSPGGLTCYYRRCLRASPLDSNLRTFSLSPSLCND